ncbi:hypothetical protein CEQ90_19585 [Lewinellaceae bacterium SD302]|nr:hypothetical protein CEQ90_19585 [Lewinellaceae bacterium SD302]
MVEVMISKNKFIEIELSSNDIDVGLIRNKIELLDYRKIYKSLIETGDYFYIETYNKLYIKLKKEDYIYFGNINFNRVMYSNVQNETLYSVSINSIVFDEILTVSTEYQTKQEYYIGKLYNIDNSDCILRKGGVIFGKDNEYEILQNTRLLHQFYNYLGEESEVSNDEYVEIADSSEQLINDAISSKETNIKFFSKYFNTDRSKLNWTERSIDYLDRIIHWNSDNVDPYLAFNMFARYIGDVLVQEYKCSWFDDGNSRFMIMNSKGVIHRIKTHSCTMNDYGSYHISLAFDRILGEVLNNSN